MTTTLTDENPTQTTGEEFDDLKSSIKGIGDKWQRWLRRSLGVRTYEDLAALTVDAIQAKIEAEGEQAVPEHVIEGWITQARELAEARSLERRAKEKFGTDGWDNLAVFLVKFQKREGESGEREVQTVVDLMDNGEDAVWHGASWPGIEAEKARQWMMDRLRARAPQVFEAAAQVAPPPAPPAFEVPPSVAEIAQVRIFQPPHAEVPLGVGLPDQPIPERVRSADALTLEVPFAFVRLDEIEIDIAQARYAVQFHAFNLTTGAVIHLGDTEPAPLVAGQATFAAALRSVNLPTGMYRLRVRVVLADAEAQFGGLASFVFEVV
ncbi:MAG: hypothetical protein M5R40_26480 [Anaerolineae bacterium]|nr:hypothetical protein [Anaerolineae bacterium]